MKLLSVSVGLPRIVEDKSEPVATGIFKTPVAGRIAVNQLNLAGDAQADLRVHGGASKSVYAYPSEHYDFWRGEMPDFDFVTAVFGENLTVSGLLETDVCIGDCLRIGTAEFVVTEPRFPCYKLGVRFGRKDIIRRFDKAERSGFYLSVARTGEIGAGDAVEIVSRDANKVSIADIVRLKTRGGNAKDADLLRRAMLVEALPLKLKVMCKMMLGRIAG